MSLMDDDDGDSSAMTGLVATLVKTLTYFELNFKLTLSDRKDTENKHNIFN